MKPRKIIKDLPSKLICGKSHVQVRCWGCGEPIWVRYHCGDVPMGACVDCVEPRELGVGAARDANRVEVDASYHGICSDDC